MRIITDENVDQLLSMSYSNNINKLLHNKDDRNTEKTNDLIKRFVRNMEMEQKKSSEIYGNEEAILLPSPVVLDTESSHTPSGPPPQYIDKRSLDSPVYAPDSNSPAYNPDSNSPAYAPNSNLPAYNPDSNLPPYVQGSDSPVFRPNITPEQSPPDASILDVSKEEEKKDESNDSSTSNESSDKKVIDIQSESNSDVSTSSETKKITL